MEKVQKLIKDNIIKQTVKKVNENYKNRKYGACPNLKMTNI